MSQRNEESSEESLIKYMFALFEAGKTFEREITIYDSGEKNSRAVFRSATDRFLKENFFDKLPLEYRAILKLPWKYVIGTVADMIKEIGDGPTEDVIKNLLGVYLESQR